MNIKNTFFILISVFSLALFYPGCDDAGVTTITQNTTFSSVHLNHLDVSENAMYELFVNIDSSGASQKWCSMGKFNINASGQPVDSAGNSKNFEFRFTPDLPSLTDAIVTMEPLNDNDTLPNGPIIMGATRTYVSGVLTYNMSMEYTGVIGSAGAQLKNDQAKYTFASPTDGDPISKWYRGIWFTTDDFGNSPGISCQSISAYQWVYHAYVISSLNPSYIYDIGRFSNPNDSDDYNACNSNVIPAWKKPGQDWLVPGCPGNGTPDIDTTVNGLNNSNYQALITIEPKNRSVALNNTPFFIKLFSGVIGLPGGYGTINTLPNVTASYLPTATVQLRQKSGQ